MKFDSFNTLIIVGIIIFALLSFIFGGIFILGFLMLMVLILSFVASKQDNYSTKRYFIAVIFALTIWTFVLYPLFNLIYIIQWIFPILGAILLAVFMNNYLENLHKLKKEKIVID